MLEPGLMKELYDILAQECIVYDGMLRLSREKTDIIVKGKVAELENTVRLEQSLILQIERMEKIREGIVVKISQVIGADHARLTISELTGSLDGVQSEKLKELQKKMSFSLNELKNVNELNAKLIKTSLEYVDFSLNLLAGERASGNNYGITGEVNESKKRSFFDVKL